MLVPLLLDTLREALSTHVGQGVAVLVVGGIAYLRLRRARKMARTAVTGLVAVGSTAATAVGITVFIVTVLVYAGWWDPPTAEIVSDVTGIGDAIWQVVGEPVIRLLIDALREVAG